MTRKRQPKVVLTAELLTAVAELRVDGYTDREIAERVRDLAPGFHYPVCNRWRNDHESTVEIGGQEYTPAEIMRSADGVMHEEDGVRVGQFADELFRKHPEGKEDPYGHLSDKAKATYLNHKQWIADRRMPKHLHHTGEVEGGQGVTFSFPHSPLFADSPTYDPEIDEGE